MRSSSLLPKTTAKRPASPLLMSCLVWSGTDQWLCPVRRSPRTLTPYYLRSVTPALFLQIPGVTFPPTHARFCGLMKILTSICAVTLALGLAAGRAAQPHKRTKEEPNKAETKSDSKQENKNVNANEVAVIKTTEGDMVVEFWPEV